MDCYTWATLYNSTIPRARAHTHAVSELVCCCHSWGKCCVPLDQGCRVSSVTQTIPEGYPTALAPTTTVSPIWCSALEQATSPTPLGRACAAVGAQRPSTGAIFRRPTPMVCHIPEHMCSCIRGDSSVRRSGARMPALGWFFCMQILAKSFSAP